MQLQDTLSLSEAFLHVCVPVTPMSKTLHNHHGCELTSCTHSGTDTQGYKCRHSDHHSNRRELVCASGFKTFQWFLVYFFKTFWNEVTKVGQPTVQDTKSCYVYRMKEYVYVCFVHRNTRCQTLSRDFWVRLSFDWRERRWKNQTRKFNTMKFPLEDVSHPSLTRNSNTSGRWRELPSRSPVKLLEFQCQRWTPHVLHHITTAETWSAHFSNSFLEFQNFTFRHSYLHTGLLV